MRARFALLTLVLALVGTMTLQATPAHANSLHGVKTWLIDHSTFGPHVYEAYANASVEESTSGASVRFRLSTECYKDGAHTDCNHAANDGWLLWKACKPSSACFPPNIGDYGPGNFGTYATGTWYGLVTGTWHSDAHKSWLTDARAVRVRYLDVNYLTPSVHVCSLYTEPDGTDPDYDIGAGCTTA